jgi:hypothetical protein
MAPSHQPTIWTPPPAIYHQLQQRLVQRASLMEIPQQMRNQLHSLAAYRVIVPEVETRFQSLITTFDQQLKALETELNEVIKLSKTLNGLKLAL